MEEDYESVRDIRTSTGGDGVQGAGGRAQGNQKGGDGVYDHRKAGKKKNLLGEGDLEKSFKKGSL